MLSDMRPLWAAVCLVCVNAVAQTPRAQPERLRPRVYSIGDGVSAPVVIQKNAPEYSEEARKANRQGTVELSLVVGRNGRAQNIKVIRSVGFGLDNQAIQSVKTWRFKPGMKDGKAVPVSATIEVNFCIAGEYCPTWKSAEPSK
jgi:TonB family protein